MIGVEVHGYLQVQNREKLFCRCAIAHEAPPNTNICPVCTAQPGCKPMRPNAEAVEKILAIALMLDCTVNKKLLFQRKHYSWPDLPSGYQRTMSGSYATPVGEHGKFLGIDITEVHLEEDPARWDPETGCVDYNRSGFPLVEIVTEPEFTSPEHVRDWLKALVKTLAYIKAIDADAGIKADVNISIAPKFERVEVKNVNSFSSIVAAIQYEFRRQGEEVAAGKPIPMQTRAWSDAVGKTEFMRSKEQAMDYMFIPDPDLPIIPVHDLQLKAIAATLPEKPHEKSARYVAEHKIDKVDADILASDLSLAVLYEKVAAEIDPMLAVRWLRHEVMRAVNDRGVDLDALELDEQHLIELLQMVEEKQITDTVAKKMLKELLEKPFSPKEYVKQHGLGRVEDKGQLESWCKAAIAENVKAVADYRKGEEKALDFLMGKVMRASRGAASADETKAMLRKLLK